MQLYVPLLHITLGYLAIHRSLVFWSLLVFWLIPNWIPMTSQGDTVPTSVTCPQQTMISEPRPRFRPISEAGCSWGFEDALARCHGDVKVNEALRCIMRWLTLSSFTTYPCIFRKNGQYTACRGHFMLSFGTRFSPLVLMVFKQFQGKVGQFNTIWIGQAPSFVPMISCKLLPRPDGPTFYIWPCDQQSEPNLAISTQKWNLM